MGKLTVEELFRKWNNGITGIILKSGVPSGDVEDVKQQVYLEFIRGQVFGFCSKCQREYTCNSDRYDEIVAENKVRMVEGKEPLIFVFYCRECSKSGVKILLEKVHRHGYEDIFDPVKGAESTFIYHFVQRRCMQFISRSYRDPLRLTSKGRSDDNEEVLDLLDIIPTKEDVPYEVDLSMAIDKLRERLDGVPVRSMVEDLNVERSLRKVFDYLEGGLRQRQIAARLNFSEPSVSLMVKEIRAIAADMGLRLLLDGTGPSGSFEVAPSLTYSELKRRQNAREQEEIDLQQQEIDDNSD